MKHAKRRTYSPNFIRKLIGSAYLYWPWLMGIGMLGFCTIFGVNYLPQIERDNARLISKAPFIGNELYIWPATISEFQADTWITQLPNFDRLPIITNDFQEFAAKQSLVLSDATYKPVPDHHGARIGKIEINVRLKGAYGPLKRAIAAQLASHKGLALESLSVRRARSTDAVLDAELRFSFFYRRLT